VVQAAEKTVELIYRLIDRPKTATPERPELAEVVFPHNLGRLLTLAMCRERARGDESGHWIEAVSVA